MAIINLEGRDGKKKEWLTLDEAVEFEINGKLKRNVEETRKIRERFPLSFEMAKMLLKLPAIGSTRYNSRGYMNYWDFYNKELRHLIERNSPVCRVEIINPFFPDGDEERFWSFEDLKDGEEFKGVFGYSLCYGRGRVLMDNGSFFQAIFSKPLQESPPGVVPIPGVIEPLKFMVYFNPQS